MASDPCIAATLDHGLCAPLSKNICPYGNFVKAIKLTKGLAPCRRPIFPCFLLKIEEQIVEETKTLKTKAEIEYENVHTRNKTVTRKGVRQAY